jgi:hypothetical protein
VDLTAALVYGHSSVMNVRVERLIAWSDARLVSEKKYPWYGLGAAMATTAGFVITYSALLVRVHAATEWLFR